MRGAFALLGLLDDVHDAGQGVVCHPGGDHHLQNAAAVDAGGEYFVTGAHLGRHRFPGDGRGVDCGAPGLHEPVGGQPLTGLDHQHVTGHEFGRIDIELDPGAHHRRSGRNQVQQCAQPAAGPGYRIVLQRLGHGEQERQHRGLADGAIAPTIATVISVPTPSRPRRSARTVPGTKVAPPLSTAPAASTVDAVAAAPSSVTHARS